MNLWHDISLGDDAPQVVKSVIEIPAGSNAKYELDKETGLMILDRVMYSAMFYPANYGFLPQTLCDDKDPLDILIISDVKMPSGTLAHARVIGVMTMIDGGEMDDKIIAVAEGDMDMAHVNELEDLPKHTLDKIQNFFELYKSLEKKEVEVKGFHGKSKAIEIIEDSIKLYNETHKN